MGGSKPRHSLIAVAAGVTGVAIAVVRAAQVGRADSVAHVLAVRAQVVKSVLARPLDRACPQAHQQEAQLKQVHRVRTLDGRIRP